MVSTFEWGFNSHVHEVYMVSLCIEGFLQVHWFRPHSKDMFSRLIDISKLSDFIFLNRRTL